MTNDEFIEAVKQYVKKGDSPGDRELLLRFKKSGGTREVAKKILEEMAPDLSDNETLQDRVYDLLDIVTDWCSPEVRVWK